MACTASWALGTAWGAARRATRVQGFALMACSAGGISITCTGPTASDTSTRSVSRTDLARCDESDHAPSRTACTSSVTFQPHLDWKPSGGPAIRGCPPNQTLLKPRPFAAPVFKTRGLPPPRALCNRQVVPRFSYLALFLRVPSQACPYVFLLPARGSQQDSFLQFPFFLPARENRNRGSQKLQAYTFPSNQVTVCAECIPTLEPGVGREGAPGRQVPTHSHQVTGLHPGLLCSLGRDEHGC